MINSKGITQNLTNVDMLHQNDAVEHKNMTVVTRIPTILIGG